MSNKAVRNKVNKKYQRFGYMYKYLDQDMLCKECVKGEEIDTSNCESDDGDMGHDGGGVVDGASGEKPPEVGNNQDSETCKQCNKRVLRGQKGVRCDSCLGWYHIGCQKVSKTMYDAYIIIQENADFKWTCRYCKGRNNSLKAENERLRNENTTLKKENYVLKKDWDRIKKEIADLRTKFDKEAIVDEIKVKVLEDLREEEKQSKEKSQLSSIKW